MRDRLLLGATIFLVGFSTAMLVKMIFENSPWWVLGWLLLAAWNCRHVIACLDRVYSANSPSTGDQS